MTQLTSFEDATSANAAAPQSATPGGLVSFEDATAANQPVTPSDLGSKAPEPDISTDVYKSLGTGLEEGLAGVGGLPGDIREGVANKIQQITGVQLPEIPAWLKGTLGNVVPGLKTTSDYMAPLEQAGLTHTPETTAGQYARTIGQFAPAAIGGEGGLIQKGAQVVAPALASETAGQLTQGTAAEPYARAAGGLVGAGGLAAAERIGSTIGARNATSTLQQALPNSKKLGQQAQQAYSTVDNAGVTLSPTASQTLVDNLNTALSNGKLGKVVQTMPAAQSILTTIADDAAAGNMKLTDLHAYQYLSDKMRNSSDGIVSHVGQVIDNGIDSFTSSLKAPDLSAPPGVDPQQIIDTKNQADALWAQSKKSQTIEELIERARNTVGANYTTAGMETALRQQFKSLSNNVNQRQYFSQPELNDIKSVVRGGTLENMNRRFGSLFPWGKLDLAAYGLGVYPLGGPYVTGALAASTGLAKLASRGATMRNVQSVLADVRTGGTFTPVTAQPLSGSQALTAIEPSIQSPNRQSVTATNDAAVKSLNGTVGSDVMAHLWSKPATSSAAKEWLRAYGIAANYKTAGAQNTFAKASAGFSSAITKELKVPHVTDRLTNTLVGLGPK